MVICFVIGVAYVAEAVVIWAEHSKAKIEVADNDHPKNGVDRNMEHNEE